MGDDIAQKQEIRLRGLFAALAGNSFYSRKYKAAGVSLAGADPRAVLASLPFTVKSELQDDQRTAPPFGTNHSFPMDRFTRMHQTSGSTGEPLRWLDTTESWAELLENWKLVYKAAQIGAGARVFFAFSFGPFLGFWTAFEAAAQLGCLCIPGGGLGSDARLKMLRDLNAEVLCCTPTYAMHLAEAARQEGPRAIPTSVQKILVAGEPGGSIPSIRERIESGWPGATVFDHHGMTEVGPVSYPCPARKDVLHVIESSYLAEVLEPNSTREADVSRAGELVLTTLGRVGSPLIRYRTGDLVHGARGTCACGSKDLALDGGILGRVDDMVFVRGVNIYPAGIERIVLGRAGVAEYQVESDERASMAELRIVIEALPGVDARALAAELETDLRGVYSLRIPVCVSKEPLPRYELKARRWRRIIH